MHFVQIKKRFSTEESVAFKKFEYLYEEVYTFVFISPLYTLKTSMMWPTQNFLLYIRNIIKMKVTEWINNLKKTCQSPPPLGMYTTWTNYNNLI